MQPRAEDRRLGGRVVRNDSTRDPAEDRVIQSAYSLCDAWDEFDRAQGISLSDLDTLMDDLCLACNLLAAQEHYRSEADSAERRQMDEHLEAQYEERTDIDDGHDVGWNTGGDDG